MAVEFAFLFKTNFLNFAITLKANYTSAVYSTLPMNISKKKNCLIFSSSLLMFLFDNFVDQIDYSNQE